MSATWRVGGGLATRRPLHESGRVTRLAALSGGLVEALDQLIVEVNAEIHELNSNRLGYVRKRIP